MSPDIEHLAELMFRALNPDPVDQLAKAVSAAFRDTAALDGGLPRQLASADLLARHRELRARATAKYGDLDELAARMQARGAGLSARVWC